jgi:hypothetical protein
MSAPTASAIAARLIARLADAGSLADRATAENMLADALEPLIAAITPLAGITPPEGVALDSVVEITVDLSPDQTRAMAELFAARERDGADPVSPVPPGPMNQPVHDLSDDAITLETFVTLSRSLARLADPHG